MSRAALVLVLPLLVFGSVHAEAARISFAGANCGSEPLLGLTFTSPIPVAGGIDGCPGFAFGSIVDPGSGVPLYGPSITSIGFTITNPGQISAGNPLDVVDDLNDDGLATTSLGSGMTFTNSDGLFLVTATAAGPIDIPCIIPDITDDAPGRALCGPPDVRIFIEDFVPGTTFRIVSVNGRSVPEPATVVLLLTGLGAAAVRRRSRSLR